MRKIISVSAIITLALTGVTGIPQLSNTSAKASGEFRSTLGTEFWLHFDDVNLGQNNLNQRINLAATSAATVTITWPDMTSQTVNVLANTVESIDATSKIGDSNAYARFDEGVKQTGVKVVSDVAISVYLASFKISQGGAYSSIVYPSNYLDTRYRILLTDIVPTQNNHEGFFSVLATEAGTTIVTLTPTDTNSEFAPQTTTLTQGQTYSLRLVGQDRWSGALIEADKKIAVSSSDMGRQFVSPASDAEDPFSAYLSPTSTWGKNFILPSNSAVSTDPSGFLIVADEDGTTVSINSQDTSLDAGDTHFFSGSDSAPFVDVVTSDKPILILKIIGGGTYPVGGGTPVTGDPGMVQVIPNEQFINDTLFTTLGSEFSSNEITIVGKTSDVSNFELDGTPINQSSFTPITGTDFSVARLAISSGIHRLTSTEGFATYIYGYDAQVGYATSGGSGLVNTVANPGGTGDTGFRTLEQIISGEVETPSSSTPAPAPYTGPIITNIGKENPAGPFETFGGQTVRVEGERLSSVTKVLIDGKEGTVVSTADDHFVIITPEGLTPGTYDLVINSALGNLTYLDGFIVTEASANFTAANAACEGVETSYWTQRISDTEAKAYIKCPAVGQKYRILQQTGGSGSYDSIFAKTLTDENDTTQVFNEFGRYIVRTIDLEDINRIRIRVDDVELWKVRYNR